MSRRESDLRRLRPMGGRSPACRLVGSCTSSRPADALSTGIMVLCPGAGCTTTGLQGLVRQRHHTTQHEMHILCNVMSCITTEPCSYHAGQQASIHCDLSLQQTGDLRPCFSTHQHTSCSAPSRRWLLASGRLCLHRVFTDAARGSSWRAHQAVAC